MKLVTAGSDALTRLALWMPLCGSPAQQLQEAEAVIMYWHFSSNVRWLHVLVIYNVAASFLRPPYPP